jgi:hypothetical protein
MAMLSPDARKRVAFAHTISDVSQELAKRKVKDFDSERFISDLKTWFDQLLKGTPKVE